MTYPGLLGSRISRNKPVIPAKAGIRISAGRNAGHWTNACAGMTKDRARIARGGLRGSAGKMTA